MTSVGILCAYLKNPPYQVPALSIADFQSNYNETFSHDPLLKYNTVYSHLVPVTGFPACKDAVRHGREARIPLHTDPTPRIGVGRGLYFSIIKKKNVCVNWRKLRLQPLPAYIKMGTWSYKDYTVM